MMSTNNPVEEKIIAAIAQMDIDVLYEVLPSSSRFNSYSKEDALLYFELIFDEMQCLGNTVFFPFEGYCHGCQKGETGIRFLANETGHFLDFIYQSGSDFCSMYFYCTAFYVKGHEKLVQHCPRLYFDDKTTQIIFNN